MSLKNMEDEKMERLIEWIQTIDTRVQTINDRTKSHTLDIKKLEKQMKELNKQGDIE